MHRVLASFVFLTLLGCSTKPHELSNPRDLDSLLFLNNKWMMGQAFGNENVLDSGQVIANPDSSVYKAVLFPGKKQQATITWIALPTRHMEKSVVSINMTSFNKEDAPGRITWRTKSNVYLGMKLSELQALNGKKIYFQRAQEGAALEVADWGQGAFQNSGLVVSLDPSFKPDLSGITPTDRPHSELDPFKDADPVVYSISVETPWTDDSMILSDTTSDSSDSPQVTIDPSTGDTLRELAEIPFEVFHTKYIKTLPLLSLPYEERDGAFNQMTSETVGNAFVADAFDGSRWLVGLLPDTSQFYGIVWSFHHHEYTTPHQEQYFEHHLTTFSKDGKVISSEQIQLRHNDDESPTSCGGSTSTMSASIEADLTFSCHRHVVSCLDEDEKQDGKAPQEFDDRIEGRVNKDGTITVTVRAPSN